MSNDEQISDEDKARIVRAIQVKSDRRLFMWANLAWRDVAMALSQAGGFRIVRCDPSEAEAEWKAAAGDDTKPLPKWPT